MTFIPSSLREEGAIFVAHMLDGIERIDPREWSMVRNMSEPNIPETAADPFVFAVLMGTCCLVVGGSFALMVVRYTI